MERFKQGGQWRFEYIYGKLPAPQGAGRAGEGKHAEGGGKYLQTFWGRG